MGSRTFNTIVALFWTSTMTWLVVAKVLPTFQVGEPPNYKSILGATEEAAEPVCWAIRGGSELYGWAATKVVPGQDGGSEIHSRVYFDRLPLSRMENGWLLTLLRERLNLADALDIDSYSWFKIDSTGKLSKFDCLVRVANMIDAISIHGEVQDQWLMVVVQSGGRPWQPTKTYFPPGALLADALSPQSRLPGLRLEQEWTEQVYSPLGQPHNPIEILNAKVERIEPIVWSNQDIETLVVTYRAESNGDYPPRSTLWIDRDGRVLKQEVSLLNSKLQFVRVSARKSQPLVETLGANWKTGLPEQQRTGGYGAAAMIQMDRVVRRYGPKVAVDNLSLEIPAGELFALLGPNGAGKTTTIKMMVGLLRPDAGSIRLCGYDVVTQSREAKRLLGFVPEIPYLYDKLTGREFLQFVAEMHGMTPATIPVEIQRQCGDFQLATFVDDLTETYSHGMKQRLAFAAALIHSPSVFVIDEPMLGLDPRSMRLLKDLLRAKAAAGMTIFMSTHLLSVAEEIADRIAIVDHGRLQFLGTIDELRQQLPNEPTTLERLYLSLTSSSVDEAS